MSGLLQGVLWRCPAAVALAWLLATAVGPGSAASRSLAIGASLACTGLLLRPPGLLARHGLGGLAVWAAACAGGLLALIPIAGPSARLGLGVVLLVGTLTSVAAWVEQRSGDPAEGTRFALLLAAWLGAAPLWGGPLAELTGAPLTNVLVAVSPLSLLAVLAEQDYLRSVWFYEHSAIGSLRYAYPPAGGLVAAYLAAVLTLAALARRLRPAQITSRASITRSHTAEE